MSLTGLRRLEHIGGTMSVGGAPVLGGNQGSVGGVFVLYRSHSYHSRVAGSLASNTAFIVSPRDCMIRAVQRTPASTIPSSTADLMEPMLIRAFATISGGAPLSREAIPSCL